MIFAIKMFYSKKKKSFVLLKNFYLKFTILGYITFINQNTLFLPKYYFEICHYNIFLHYIISSLCQDSCAT